MSSVAIQQNENSINTNELSIPLPSKIHKSKKCRIKDTYGIITPQDNDIMTSFSYSDNKGQPQKEKSQSGFPIQNIIKVKITDSNKIWSKNPFYAIKPSDVIDNKDNKENKPNNDSNPIQFKVTQEYIRTINKDSIEIIIPSKPLLNSTASKSYMQEYSKSSKYQKNIKNSEKENFFNQNDSQSDKNSENSDKNCINEEAKEEEDSINSIDGLIKYQESHLPVPIKEKDNENFKILTMKKMKRKTMPPNKSLRKFAEDREPNYEKDFRITNSFCKLLKRKVVHSSRRIYSSNFLLNKGKKQVNFKIFRDKDIGVYEYWQTHIHESHIDEDVETDEEQKSLAKCFTLGEIKEAMMAIKNGNYKDTFINFNRYAHLRSKEENENIQKQLRDLKCKLNDKK